MASNTFEDKVVVITGASSGIDRELVHQLTIQGAWLSLAARDVKRLEMVVAECRGLGGKTFSIRTDVSYPVQCEAWVRQTVEHYGRIDVLVNNAGITRWANFEDIQDLKPFDRSYGSITWAACIVHTMPYRILNRPKA